MTVQSYLALTDYLKFKQSHEYDVDFYTVRNCELEYKKIIIILNNSKWIFFIRERLPLVAFKKRTVLSER